MKFTKIDFSGRRIKVVYEQPNQSEDTNRYTFECHDQPDPKLRLALLNLREHAVAECELDGMELNRVDVVKLAFYYDKDRPAVMGVEMTINYHLLNSDEVLSITTPRKFAIIGELKYDPRVNLTDKCMGVIQCVMAETEAYIAGIRQQIDLFETEAA
jgi:hypothetical protein